jgi:hypothetical protein
VTGSESLAVVNAGVPETARALAEEFVAAGGGEVAAIILYGSQLHRSSPNAQSAWDLVVIVDAFPPFHRALRASGHHTRSPILLNLMGAILPPYVTAFAPWGAGRPMAKCVILRRDQFRRAMGPGSRDHFLKGRLVQHVETVWAASPGIVEDIDRILARARRETLDWVGPFLDDQPFDSARYSQEMLRVSFAAELRPESSDRVQEVWRSQADWMVPTFADVLEEAAEDDVLSRTEPASVDSGDRFTLAHPPGAWARLRYRGYFFRSKYRSVARWFKHIVTFNDWLTYIQNKVERRTGMTVELTAAERRWPLILLWPKVVKVLREGRRERNVEGPDS